MHQGFATIRRLAAAGLAAWLSSSVASARPLVVYSPHGADMLKMMAQEFRKEVPGADIDWRFLSSEEVYDQLKEEKVHPVADLWWGGPQFTFMRGAHDGLLEPYQPTWDASEPVAYRDAQRRWYGDLQTPLTMIYNRNLVQAADIPKDWDDFLKPAYKGKLVVRFPLDSGTMRATYLAMIDRQVAKGRTLDEALSWMKSLEAAVARYVPYSQLLFSAVGKGILPFSFWNAPEMTMRQRQGYPVDFVYPASGMPILLDCIALVKRVDQHPLAKRFYEFVTSKKMEERLADEPFNRLMARTDLGKLGRPDFMDDPRFKVMPVDWRRVSENETKWMGRWEREVAGQAKGRP